MGDMQTGASGGRASTSLASPWRASTSSQLLLRKATMLRARNQIVLAPGLTVLRPGLTVLRPGLRPDRRLVLRLLDHLAPRCQMLVRHRSQSEWTRPAQSLTLGSTGPTVQRRRRRTLRDQRGQAVLTQRRQTAHRQGLLQPGPVRLNRQRAARMIASQAIPRPRLTLPGYLRKNPKNLTTRVSPGHSRPMLTEDGPGRRSLHSHRLHTGVHRHRKRERGRHTLQGHRLRNLQGPRRPKPALDLIQLMPQIWISISLQVARMNSSKSSTICAVTSPSKNGARSSKNCSSDGTQTRTLVMRIMQQKCSRHCSKTKVGFSSISASVAAL